MSAFESCGCARPRAAGLHTVSKVYDPDQLVDRGGSVYDATRAVVGKRVEAFGERGLVELAPRGAMRNQLIELAVHLQDFHDRHAPPVALVVALVAAYGAVDHGYAVGDRAEQIALPGARFVGLLAVLAQLSDQALGDNADDVAGEDVGDDADIEEPRDRAHRRVGMQGGIHL